MAEPGKEPEGEGGSLWKTVVIAIVIAAVLLGGAVWFLGGRSGLPFEYEGR
jgi:hypothetical protein